MKSPIIFAICFLVGAAAAVGVRATMHRPYAEAAAAQVMTQPTTPAAPAPAHEGHQPSPAPAPQHSAPAAAPGDAKPSGGHGHHGHGAWPAATSDGAPATAVNAICPVCGMEVDGELAAVPTPHGAVGIGCAPCAAKIARDPDRYGPAARENRKAP